MREQQRRIGSRGQVNSTSNPSNLALNGGLVNTLIDPGKNQTAMHIAEGLSQLAPALQSVAGNMIHNKIVADTNLGQQDAALGLQSAATDDPHRVYAFGLARANTIGIEEANKALDEVAGKYSPESDKDWGNNPTAVDAVSAHFQDKAKQLIQGMDPEHAAIMLQHLERSRMSAVVAKQKETHQYVHGLKLQNTATMVSDKLAQYIVDTGGQFDQAALRQHYSEAIEFGVSQGLSRKEAAQAVAEQFATTAIDNKSPEMLNFLHQPDKDGVTVRQTKQGETLLKAQAVATKAKNAVLDMDYVNDLADAETLASTGELTPEIAQQLNSKWPGKMQGHERQLASLLHQSQVVQIKNQEKNLIESATSADMEYKVNAGIDKADLEDAAKLAKATPEQLEDFVRNNPKLFRTDKEAAHWLQKQVGEYTKAASNPLLQKEVKLSQIPDSQAKTEYVSEKLDMMSKEGKKGGYTDEQVLNTQIAYLVREGQVHKPLADTINQGLLTSDPTDVNSQATPEFLQSVKTYEKLRASNPGLAYKYVDDSSRAILDNFLSARDSGYGDRGADDATAWEVLKKRMADPGGLHSKPGIPPSRDELQSAVSELPGYDDYKNQSEIDGIYKSKVSYYMGLGQSAQKAMESARGAIEGQYQNILGTMSYVGKNTLPPDTDAVMTKILSTKFPGVDTEDYQVHAHPTLSGVFVVYDSEGIPVPNSSFDFYKEYPKYQGLSGEDAVSMFYKKLERSNQNKLAALGHPKK